MTNNKYYDYERAKPMPDWLKDFAEKELRKDANPLDDIKNLFQMKQNLNAVEDKVSELRNRVGLNLVEGEEEQNIKTASDNEYKDEEGKKRLLENTDLEETKRKVFGFGETLRSWNLKYDTFPDIDNWVEENWPYKYGTDIVKDYLLSVAEERSSNYWGSNYNYEKHRGKANKLSALFKDLEGDLLNEMGANYTGEPAPITMFYNEKEAASQILQLISLANKLEEQGNHKLARLIDSKIKKLADCHECLNDAKDDVPEILKKNEGLKNFIDNLCKSRGGHIAIPAIMQMIDKERKERVADQYPDIEKYIEKKIKEEKVDLPDEGDDVAGLTHTVLVITDGGEEDGNNEMFAKPTKL